MEGAHESVMQPLLSIFKHISSSTPHCDGQCAGHSILSFPKGPERILILKHHCFIKLSALTLGRNAEFWHHASIWIIPTRTHHFFHSTFGWTKCRTLHTIIPHGTFKNITFRFAMLEVRVNTFAWNTIFRLHATIGIIPTITHYFIHSTINRTK